ncbi:MAG TPA: carboxypeptidase-like regulatory domain-containing protein [Thermoanaerobaculia bacterium]|nr:carboxypeptidase-like regulatory domain-containing protein [Thermoanaerobaculia bacterium]
MSTGNVEGRVTDLSNNSPIPGAEVEVKGDEKSEEKQVDEEGYFRFTDLPPGEYVLEVAAEGFESGFFGPFPVLADDTTRLPVALAPDSEE